MALFLPPAVSVNKFVGGFKSVSDYTDLADTETNDAQNVLYSSRGDLEQRPGSLRLYNRKLTSNGSTTGEPIKGHYYFNSFSDGTGVSVVAAGDSVYSYSSATAVSILTGQNSGSTTFYTFAQIQNPTDASQDMAVWSNGVDSIKVWAGSGTATLLSAFAGSTGVPIGKYITTHKNRIYVANIVDPTDVDSPFKVAISSFGSDGAPDPHIFRDFFYVGGSAKTGEITGIKTLNDQIIIYTKNSVWKFNPGNGNSIDTASLQQMQESIGLLAPFSLVDVGNFHIFLSERGVYGFDGVNFEHISDKIDNFLLDDSTKSALKFSYAAFDKNTQNYVLYFPFDGSTRNNRGIAYDLNIKAWQPVTTGRVVSVISDYISPDTSTKLLYGDYSGFLYQDGVGTNDGITQGFNGSPTTTTISSLSDTSKIFPTTGDGLSGMFVRIISGKGVNQERLISSNTATSVNFDLDWATVPDATSVYTIGGINSYWRSKDYDFTGHDITKIFRSIRVRVREEGNFSLILNYLIDFRNLANSTARDIVLRREGFTWGLSRWGMARWGRLKSFTAKVNLINTTMGNHIAFRFSSPRANETFRLSGFDVEFKAIGKR